MKFLAVFLLAIFAVGSVRADSEECTEERAEACIDSLLSAVLDDATEEEVCKELRSSVDCLKDAVDDCFGDERDPEVEEGLEELEKILKDNCETGGSDGNGVDEETEKCFEENEDYFLECVEVGTNQALTLILEKGNMDENYMKCTLYTLMAHCFVERIGEKCGDTAAALAEEELTDVPSDIKEACDEVEEELLFDFNLLEDKRKK